MSSTLETALVSAFFAFLITDKLNTSARIRTALKLKPLKTYLWLKPLECPTCLSFWIALGYGAWADYTTAITAAATAWLITTTIDKLPREI